MALTGGDWIYLGLLAAVGVGRLGEMRISRRHQRALAARGFARERDAGFPWMVALHTSVLVGAGIEVLVARRPIVPVLAGAALGAFVAANLLRLWVIRTMAEHWNVNVVNSLGMGVVSSGPFRWVRHPNYVAVFVELLALPLMHSAIVTAVAGSVLHIVVLSRRITLEEKFLMTDATYREVMGGRPRFVPRPFPRPAAMSPHESRTPRA